MLLVSCITSHSDARSCNLCLSKSKSVSYLAKALNFKLCFLCVCARQESEGQGCPFCRCEIKGTEPIVVDPFHPKASGASFAGFQGSSRAEAAANDEEEDDRLEDQHLVMSRLACAKVRGQHIKAQTAARSPDLT